MKIKMKNYAKHLWLSLLLLVGATAIAVPGLNGTNSGGVAKIGETEYATLQEAIAAATAEQTITLLANIDATEQIEVGKQVTLDLNGKTIEYKSEATLTSGVIMVLRGGDLTVTDTSEGATGAIKSGTKAYAAIALTKKGETSTETAKLTVNNGTIEGYYYAIVGNGTRHGTEITINGGVIKGTADGNQGIYHPQEGTLTINGGTISGYSSAVELRSGTLNITGGTLSASCTEFNYEPNNSGTTTAGAVVAIAQHNTLKAINVSIAGATLNGAKTIAVTDAQNNNLKDITVSVADALTEKAYIPEAFKWVSDGTMSTLTPRDPVAKIDETVYYSLADAVEAAGTEATTIKMLANASSDQITIPADKNIVIDFAGYTVTPTGKWLIINKGALTLSNTAEGAGGITSTFKGLVDNYGTLTVNSGTYSTTAEIAFWNNDENSTITVNGGSVSSSANVIIAENGSAVNVAGGTITATGEESYGIYSTSSKVNVSGGKVTAATEAIHLQTSSTATISGDATVEVTGEETWGVVILSNSTLTVKDNAKITSNGFAISGNGSEGQGGTTVNIEGGTVTGGSAGIYQPQSGNLNITGGTISGETGVYVKSGELSVTGGAINGTGAKADYNFNGNGANPTGDALVIDNCSYPGGAPTASITGGYFKSDNGDPISSYATTGNTVISNFVSGGFFNSEVSEDLCSDGFVCTDNDDTTYMFAVKTKEDAGIFELIDRGNDPTTTPYTRTETVHAQQVTYIRKFSNTNLAPWYVPFDMEITEELASKFTFYRPDMVKGEVNDDGVTTSDNNYLQINEKGVGYVLKANKPYFVKAKQAGEFTFTVTDVDLEPAVTDPGVECSTTSTTFKFNGNYDFYYNTGNFLLMRNNKLQWSNNRYGVYTFRWYITTEGKDDWSKINLIITEEDSEATGIVSTNKELSGEIEGYYSPNGVKLEAPIKGLNIVKYKNGSSKKIYKK